MPTITDQAVVIRQWDFSETSQTVSLFTLNHGVIRGLAKGARREKGSFSGGLDVLTGGQIVAIIKPGRELATLTAWHVQQMYPAVRRSLAANRIGLYMADLIHHMIINQDPHPAVFESLTEGLEQLGEADRLESVLLQFQWQLLKEAGYEPQVHADARTGRPLPKPADAAWYTFSAEAGGLILDPTAAQVGECVELSDGASINPQDRARSRYNVTSSSNAPVKTQKSVGFARDRVTNVARSWKVRRDTIDVLRNINELDSAKVNPESVNRANRLLAAYFREIIGSEPPAMRWAFSDLAEPASDRH